MKKILQIFFGMVLFLCLLFVIITILINLPIDRFMDLFGHKEINPTSNVIWDLTTGINNYCMDTGRYPLNFQGLQILINKPSGKEGDIWRGPYINSDISFKDSWGRNFHYKYPGIHNKGSFDLWSYGADGKKGGRGGNADIGNW